MGKWSVDRQLQSAHKARRKWDALGAREDGEERSTAKGANTKPPIVLRRSPISSLHYSSHFSLVLSVCLLMLRGFLFLFLFFIFISIFIIIIYVGFSFAVPPSLSPILLFLGVDGSGAGCWMESGLRSLDPLPVLLPLFFLFFFFLFLLPAHSSTYWMSSE